MIPRLASAIERASVDERLTDRPLRVLLIAWRHLDWVEYRSFKLDFIVGWMKNRGRSADPSAIGKALRSLTEWGYLEAGATEGRLKTYRLAIPGGGGPVGTIEPTLPQAVPPERRGIRHGGIAA